MKKKFYRLYYRRNVSKTITSLVCVIGTTVTKAGATFNTEGAVDQLFVGMSVSLDGNAIIRVASITSDTEFELASAHDASETITGVFTTPALSNMLGLEMITEVDSYWKEFIDVEIGAHVGVEKGETIQVSTGITNVLDEKGMIEFNVLGFQESSATAEGRFYTLRTELNQKNVDILLFNYKVSKPKATAYYGVFGDVTIDIPTGGLPKIIISVDETESEFSEDNINVFTFTIETPILNPDNGASTLDVTISCVTVGAKMYMTINGDTPDELDTFVENYEVYSVTAAMTVKVKAFMPKMTDSAVGSGTYT